jgi:hypothetical protein
LEAFVTRHRAAEDFARVEDKAGIERQAIEHALDLADERYSGS